MNGGMFPVQDESPCGISMDSLFLVALRGFPGFQAEERGPLQLSLNSAPTYLKEMGLRFMHVAKQVQVKATTRCDLTIEIIFGLRAEPTRRMVRH